ncbi:MAG: amidohydrolase family protein [Mariniphaga sp.]|nr:amidohydrolase family protein [Mariniphaga sp.]
MKPKILAIMLLVLSICSCQKTKFYTMEDFPSVKKMDAHYHIYTSKNNSVEQAEKDNFSLLNINTFSGGCERVVDVHHWLRAIKQEHPGSTEFTATFCLDGWDEPGWVENTIAWIDQCIADGAVAVKVWKNIGMEWRDRDSSLIMIDDPQFYPVFRHLEQKRIPLVGHMGEPKNCWLPLEEMTTKNDSSYFARNPQYHMYRHPEFPSYEEQMAARDRMLEKHPNLIFIACHLASLEWSTDEMAAFLDHFPNASMDMAARMGQLFYQTVEDREKVRNFFIKYQDRLLYGTDIIDRGEDKASHQQYMHETWLTDWEYLVTDHKMTSKLIDGEFRGLELPREVIDKIYSSNAKKWYGF